MASTANAQARFEIRGYVPVRCSSTAFAPVTGSDISLAADSCNSFDRITVSMERQRLTEDGSLVSLATEGRFDKAGRTSQKDVTASAESGTSIVQVVTVSI